ncbi:bifunctional phosphatase PAP2/diacylglycerol kinase family protein [Nocardia arizonensis]|uniref:bifunctional phosphatase PAP2/diacylglycerol kinase family protein n=1 Tax=Nocardia arizonensis TaxID=1141647 RepID=UPI0009E9C3A3|nr:bifunctional phosphatase PAP2/diacylglycerol kinase family protein [Nocardia arizonensis]
MDKAISGAVAGIPVTAVDAGMLRLTHTADYGLLWGVVAAALATRPGATRRAALRGMVSVGGASFVVNVILKSLVARRRPAAELLPVQRRLVNVPTSSSFPSGHSAAAAAFATAVALESPRTGLVVAPLAATVAYSRVHTGVHWATDVAVGAAVGSGVALATSRWWPVRESDEAEAHIVRDVAVLAEGKGLVLLVNPVSGSPGYDPTDDVAAALPAATVLRTEPGRDCVEQLTEALAKRTDPPLAVGAAGGDGTIAAAATVALRHGLPLAVIPTGTLNHFARDLGVYDLLEIVDATGAGEAVGVDIAGLELGTPDGDRVHHWINTASLGAYPDLVRLREKWQDRWGKWPAFVAALVVTLRRSEPIRVRLNQEWHDVWFVFVGNGVYHPRGAIPAFRARIDDGLLDVRWLRADLKFSRIRAVAALLLAAIGRSKVYSEKQVRELIVHLDDPQAVAADGEVLGEATRLRFTVAGQVTAYRRDEDNPRWADRARPHHRRPLSRLWAARTGGSRA